MSAPSSKPRVIKAIEALQELRRGEALSLLNDEVRLGPATGDRWRSICQLASRIGAIDLALEAARRYSETSPIRLDRKLHYWSELVSCGRVDAALADVKSLPANFKRHPAVLNFTGTVASQEGRFDDAESIFRELLDADPLSPQVWSSLAHMKRFKANDPDLMRMESLAATIDRFPVEQRSAFLFGIGKAWHDCGEYHRAFEWYEAGAQIRHAATNYQRDAVDQFADATIIGFTKKAMSDLQPSREMSNQAIFVNGLPRSGTTLVEQIVASNSEVADGGEVGLFRAVLESTVGYSIEAAIAYEARTADKSDPWGDLAREYLRCLRMRFPTNLRLVDKTLQHSRMMGMIAHTLPDSKIIWLRRNAADNALSCFRTHFANDIPWSWSFADIAHAFSVELKLYQHWENVLGDRMLTVPYDELVSDPELWIEKIAHFCGLKNEQNMHEAHRSKRAVKTASFEQVRRPISTNSIGQAKHYEKYMAEYFDF